MAGSLMSPDLAVIIVAALPYASQVTDKILAYRKAEHAADRKHEIDMAKARTEAAK